MTEPIRKLGRYELLRQLATGGMGEIYLARTRGAGGFEKHMIIKKILPHLAEQDEFVTKFLDEGRIVVQLTHGNIVPVFDMGEEDGEYFIAMEYVPGLDLRAVLKRLITRGEQMAIGHALYIASEVCKGLGYAHRKTDHDGNSLGIVHRDVSPSNVLISREGEIKIIDFGIARAAGKAAETATGAIQGKCCYMSPEQARGKPLDARSDIFSTGTLLYEMLTLKRPFEGRSDLESLELVRQCNADPPGVLRPEVPGEVDDIVERAMQPDPDDRYQSIDDMFVDLQNAMHLIGQTVTSQRLAEAFDDVFADEEAEDDAEKKRRPPANLDEAFELELAKLGDDFENGAAAERNVLELASTEVELEGNNTRTLTPTPRESPGAMEGDGPDKKHPQDDPPPPSHDDHSPQADDASDESPQTTGTESEDEAQASETDASPNLRQRSIAAVVIAAVVVTAGVATVNMLRPAPEANWRIETDPPGASIHVNGRQMDGYTTPATLSLEQDEYDVELLLDDHDPHRFRVDLRGEELLEDRVELSPRQREVRRFEVTTTPEGALLMTDGEQLGTAPQTVEVPENDVVNVSARAAGCSTVYYALSFSHSRDHVELQLECEDVDESAEPDEADRPDETAAPPPPPAGRTIRVTTEPPNADVLVDGEMRGQAPVDVEIQPGDTPLLEAHLDGYEAHQTTLDANHISGDELELRLEPLDRGCLNFRAVYPAHNEIAVNGEWLDGRHMRLQKHPLPAGNNTITVRHPESDREESFDIEIEPGEDCAVLTVWERD